MQNEIRLFMENNMGIDKEYIKSSNYRYRNIINELTNSEVSEIIVGKYNELKMEKDRLQQEIFGVRGESREILERFSKGRQEELQKIINKLNFVLKQRNPQTRTENIPIEELKERIGIIDLIERLTGENINYSRKLYKCFLPDHNDKTASFKIYEDTNTWFCNGCKKGGDHINFIEHYFRISRNEAMKKFKLLTK